MLFRSLSFGSAGTLSLGKASPSNGLSAFADKVADLGVDVLFPAIALSLIMFIGALLEMYYAYCTYDAYAGEKKRLAESHIAEDRLLYEKVYFDIVSSPEKNLEYERRERELDRKALECAFKVNKLSTQLNSCLLYTSCSHTKTRSRLSIATSFTMPALASWRIASICF